MIYCVDCEVEMEEIKANFTFKEGKIVVKDLPAYKCPKCSKVVFEVATISHAKKILEEAIEVKPIKFDRKLDFDGKSLIMRIPKQIQAALDLKKGKKLKMWIRDEKHVMLEL